MSPTASIRRRLVECQAAALDAALDDGPPEDVADKPRALLVRAIKGVDGFRLGPTLGGILLVGELQTQMNALLAKLDATLPRQSRETTMEMCRPALAEIVAAIPQLMLDVKRLDAFASPLAIWD